jgi:hypothetical protein
MKARYIGQEDDFITRRGEIYEVLAIEQPRALSGKLLDPWFRVFLPALKDDYIFPPKVFEVVEEAPGEWEKLFRPAPPLKAETGV